MPDMTAQNRPVGVTVIACLLGLQGLYEVILGTLALLSSQSGGYVLTASGSKTEIGLAGFYLIAGLVKFLIVWGLLSLKRWAFILTILIAGISLATSCYSVSSSHFVFWTMIIDMIIPAVIWIYFILNDDVRAAFHFG